MNEGGRRRGEAFVLHAYAYRETSLLVEAFIRGAGKMMLVARGARRPRSALRGLLMSFQPLSLAWIGKGEVRTLSRAEWIGGQRLLQGEALLCGFYLNELLLRLLAREDPHEGLYDAYREAIGNLAANRPSAPILRRFEKSLLKELGYAMVLDRDGITGEKIRYSESYRYDPEKGPTLIARSIPFEAVYFGKTLIDMAADDYDDPNTLQQSKTLMRALIDHRLERQTLKSRRIFRELLEL
ncbi:MAG: DNA repair protein RecO [Betaproteobacteria bacterium]|nr:DNA repair protein RecO [Betaproteobacteria bacterium]